MKVLIYPCFTQVDWLSGDMKNTSGEGLAMLAHGNQSRDMLGNSFFSLGKYIPIF